MNTFKIGRIIRFRGVWAVGLAVLMLAAGGATPAHAADGSWTSNVSSTWSTAGNWAGLTIADEAGSTAWFTNNITATRTITNDTSRTLGNVIVGDRVTPNVFSFIPGGGATLTFDKGLNSYNAQLTQTNPSAANIVGVPLILANSLDIFNWDVTDALTLTNGITGTGNLTLKANNTGPITLSTVPLNHAGTITNSGSGAVSAAGLATISGGVGANVTAITENSTNSALTISTLPLTVNSGGTTLANINASGSKVFTLSGGVNGTGDLILKNNSSVSGGITFPSGVVTNVGQVINSGTGPSNVLISAVIGPNVTAVIQNSTNSQLTLSGVNTFTNGLTIKAGTVKGTLVTAFGSLTSVVTLGDTNNGSADTTLIGTWPSGNTCTNPIVVASNNTGIATIVNFGDGGRWSGLFTLCNHDLTLSAPAPGFNFYVMGGVAGTGNLTLKADGTSDMIIGPLPINNSGVITNSGVGSVAVVISGGVGSNVTAVIEASTNSALTIKTTELTVNSGGTTLANNNTSGSAVLTLSGGVNGTGDLVLKNNSAIADGITLSTLSVTNMGRVVNSGTGTNTLISALIKPPVSHVVQDSATSPLVLSGANTYTGGTTISNGTLRVINTTGSGTGTGGVGVNNGGVLEGDGTIAGTVTNYDGGIIAPGTNAMAIGTLTVGNLVWNGGGVFHCQVNDIANDALTLGHYDHLSVTGALTAVPAGNLVIRMDSMDQTLAFDTNRNYSLQVITCGTTPTLTWSDVTLDTSEFALDNTGTWSVTNLNKSIWVVYRSSAQEGKNYWRGSGTSTNWNTAGNWSLTHVPQPGEGVEFDGFAGANCGAKGVSNNLGSLTLASGYTGAVTFVSNGVAGGMDLTLAGDLTVQEGSLVFNGDTTAVNAGNGGTVGIPYGIGYTIQASNIFVGAAGSINADYKGFASGGPGRPAAGGSSYGGQGGQSDVTAIPGVCYGSATGPTALGSSSAAGSGGGAIKLSAAGAITVNGRLSANGQGHASLSGSSGGSIWIAAGTLDGTGLIAANGGDGDPCEGGGGRIDLSGVTNNFSGLIQASGAAGGAAQYRGMTGSILLPQSAGTGLTLNNFLPYTNIAFGNSLTFSNAVITNGVTVSLDANTNQNTFTFTSLTIATNSAVKCLGNLLAVNAAAGGSAANPYGQGVTIIATTVTVQAGGSLNADGVGYRKGPAGDGSDSKGNNIYGGLNTLTADGSGSPYGSISNVAALGCGGDAGGFGKAQGGGAIKLVVVDTLTVNGAISCIGVAVGTGIRGGSGGSLWIDCAMLQGAGAISADGCNNSAGGGGLSGSGGRIHILYTAKGGTNPIDNGGVTVYGGGTTINGKSAAGTILLTDRGAGDLYGTLMVANNLAASNLVTTLLSTNCFAGTPPQVTVDRVIVSGTGVLEIPSNKTLNVVSVFSNSASFLAGTNSTVALVGTSAAFVYGTSNLFYNLEATNVGKVIQFEANGTNSVLGVLTLKNCTLNSTVNGTWWYLGLDPAGSQNVYQVTVKDSNATNGQEIVAVRSTDSGHNIHWRFSNMGTGTAFTIR